MKINKIIAVIMFCFATVTVCKSQQKENITIITKEEAKTALSKDKNLVLVDVRTPAEFAEGHIKGAENINLHDTNFKEQMAKFVKNEPIYLYCRSGKRSANAAKQLQEMGFTEIYDIEGGYLNWKE